MYRERERERGVCVCVCVCVCVSCVKKRASVQGQGKARHWSLCETARGCCKVTEQALARACAYARAVRPAAECSPMVQQQPADPAAPAR